MLTRIACCAGIAFVSFGAAASAQTSASPMSSSPQTTATAVPNGVAPPPVSGTPGDTLSEVIVTATRRPERLQDVPQQIQVTSGSALQLRHLEGTTDLQYSAPALTFTAGANSGSSTFSIRGIGTAAPLPSVEQSVGLNIDGVAIGIEGAGISTLLDVNRVEVIEGPAGTLFGKNASAGLVTIYSNAPDLGKFSALTHDSYGTFNESQTQDVINIPLGDKMAVRLAGLYEYYDGVSTNLADGKDVNGLDQYAFRGRLRWEPTSQLRVDLIGAYDNNHSSCCNSAFRVDPETPLNSVVAADEAVGEKPSPDNTNVALTPGLPITRAHDTDLQAEINYDPGPLTLTSLTAYRTYYSMIYIDASFGIPPISANRQTNDIKQFSQEFRAASDKPLFGRLDYVGGLYYYHSNLYKDQILFPAADTDTLSPVSDTSRAVFGQATLHVTDQLRFIGGGRYTHDRVAQSDLLGSPGMNATPSSTGYTLEDTGFATASNFSYRAGLQYDFVRGVMGYATITEGYKGPAYSQVPAAGGVGAHGAAVLPELSTEYEVGLKSSFLNRRLTFDLTGFEQDFRNYQASIFNEALFITYLTNAGAARTRGVEGETVFRPLSGLTLTARATLDKAVFTDFQNDPCSTGFLRNYADICSGPGGTTNATGRALPNSPRFAYNLVGTYQHNVADRYTASITAGWNYRTRVNFETTGDPYTVQPSYGVLGATIDFGSRAGHWNISIYGRNLLDQRFATGIQAAPRLDGSAFNQTVSIDEFRTVGVALDARFN